MYVKKPKIELYLPSAINASVKVLIKVISFRYCAVTSTGLRGAANGKSFSKRACDSAGISGIGKPMASAASEIITPAPPLTVITPRVLFSG